MCKNTSWFRPPQKRLLGRHMEMGVEGRKKSQYGKKKLLMHRQGGWEGGRVFWFVLLFLNKGEGSLYKHFL